ncbi:helix-turn-helix domain-containing protein [Neobacillus vireti]|uniref:helix-turn-helix domain-containing protein n=1 Tax=Neobacillus vireti TaxID=220686 RepID=UPI002FFD6C28
MKEKTIYIGKVLRTLRIAKGLTQEKLANEINLDRGFISELERNKKAPSYYTIFKLAKGLGMPPEEFTKKVNESLDFDSMLEQEFTSPKMDK